jgi:hypothetical protein
MFTLPTIIAAMGVAAVWGAIVLAVKVISDNV